MINTVIDIAEYLDEAIASFEADPADTDYQQGYLAALTEVQKHFNLYTEKTNDAL